MNKFSIAVSHPIVITDRVTYFMSLTSAVHFTWIFMGSPNKSAPTAVKNFTFLQNSSEWF